MVKKLRVLVLMHEDLMPPEDVTGLTQKQMAAWKTEYDILWALDELEHEVLQIGLRDDLGVLRRAIEDWKPDLVFNVLEEFHGVTLYGQAVISFVELMRQAYTGCNPHGLMLAHDKLLTKKILTYHGINTARCVVYPAGRTIRPPADLRWPLFVKSATEDASLGISQASVVRSEDKLLDRVEFMHEQFGTDVLVEEYIEGRELYLGMMGNARLDVFPVWEMEFNRWPEGKDRIATEKVKWDHAYQVKHGILTGPARGLPPGAEREIVRVGREVFRALGLSGYARLDLRLTPDGEVYVIEANANPDLAHDEDFAKSAKASGLDYPDLIQRILRLGLAWRPLWKRELESTLA